MATKCQPTTLNAGIYIKRRVPAGNAKGFSLVLHNLYFTSPSLYFITQLYRGDQRCHFQRSKHTAYPTERQHPPLDGAVAVLCCFPGGNEADILKGVSCLQILKSLGTVPISGKTLSEQKGHSRSSGRVQGYSRSSSRNTKFHSRNGIPRLEQYANQNARSNSRSDFPELMGTLMKYYFHLAQHSRSVFSRIGVVPARKKSPKTRGTPASRSGI